MKLSRNGLITSILVIAALFVGSYISSILPVPDRIMSERPFLHEAKIGDTVHLRTADTSVTAVQTAREIEHLGEIAGTSGIWIVFDITWNPQRQPSLLPNRAIAVRATDGRTFGDMQAVTNNCGPTQPGLPVACQIAIEITEDALEGAHLLIPADGSINASDDVADFDLGIDADRAAALAQVAERITLKESEVSGS